VHKLLSHGPGPPDRTNRTQRLPDRCWNPLEAAQYPVKPTDIGKARVATEQFVAALARQRDLDPARAGGLGDEVDVQPIEGWLVQRIGPFERRVFGLIARDVDLTVLQSEELRRLAGQS